MFRVDNLLAFDETHEAFGCVAGFCFTQFAKASYSAVRSLASRSISSCSRFSAASCFRCQRSADHLSDKDEDATKKKYNHDDKQVVRDCLPKVDFDAAPEIEANSNDNCTA